MSTVPFLSSVSLKGLATYVTIGVDPGERRSRQKIMIDLTMYGDFLRACQTDSIEYTVDYRHLECRLLRRIQDSKCFLIERLAYLVASVCLEEISVKKVEVEVKKRKLRSTEISSFRLLLNNC